VTIDGETAKDFDDAVWCEPLGARRQGDGCRLVVAIADVSHYVRDGDRDRSRCARARTSVYFPRRVIRCCPRSCRTSSARSSPTSTGCAWSPTCGSRRRRDRSYEFYPAVMHSRARLTYTQVWDWLSSEVAARAAHAALMPQLRNLYALYQVLAKARKKRGAIDFETVETVLEFDDTARSRGASGGRNDAHRLIEECMLAANVCARTS
jgi:ribonuclease R